MDVLLRSTSLGSRILRRFAMADILTERELLEAIRDLLLPIAAVYRPQYEDLVRSKRRGQIDAILSIAGRGAKRVAACKLMDGSRTRKEIADASKIDGGDLSRLIKTLTEGELVVEEQGRPRLIVEPSIVWSE